MSLYELGREAVAALSAHRLRSFLTLLGIIIGVGTLVGVVSVITGLNGYVRERVIRLAPDVYVVQKLGIIQSRQEYLDAQKRRDIDWKDYERLRTVLTKARAVAADATSTSVVKRRDRRLADVQVHGTTANYGSLMRLDIEAGRYFTHGEDQAGRTVAVIGWDIKDELFGPLDPVGREMLIGTQSYRVVGLVAQQGRLLERTDDPAFTGYPPGSDPNTNVYPSCGSVVSRQLGRLSPELPSMRENSGIQNSRSSRNSA